MDQDQSVSSVDWSSRHGYLTNSSLSFLENFIFPVYVTRIKLACVTAIVLLTLHVISYKRKLTSVFTAVFSFRRLCSEKREKLKFPQVTWFNSRMNLPLILNGWYTVSQIGTVGMSVFTDCARKHGATFRLPFGPLNVIATADPSLIKKLLNSNDPHHLNKSGYIYKRLFVEELHDGLFVSKFSTWMPHRKCLSRGFTFTAILSYLSIINERSKELTNDLLAFIKKHNEPLQDGNLFAHFLSTHLLRFTCDLIIGRESHSDELISQIQDSISTHKSCLLHVFRHPLLFLRPLWRLHSMKAVSDRATQTMLAAIRQMIVNYKSKRPIDSGKQAQQDNECVEEGKFEPLIELMLESEWSEKEILDNFATFIFAENEATFSGIQWALVYLALHPEHQAICRNEIDTIFNWKQVSSGKQETTSFTNSDLSKLKYLERCILESLRLSPPVPLFARRLGVPLKVSNDLEISAGQTIVVMPWVLHRDPALYPNPNEFNPDRFLPENVKTRVPFSYLPFSAGRRNCLGWKLSQIQLKVTVASLLRHFEISTSDKVEDIKLFYAVRIIPEKNFNIIFKRRELV